MTSVGSYLNENGFPTFLERERREREREDVGVIKTNELFPSTGQDKPIRIITNDFYNCLFYSKTLIEWGSIYLIPLHQNNTYSNKGMPLDRICFHRKPDQKS